VSAPASLPAYELCVFRGEDVTRYPIPEGSELTIGRAEGCDVRIDHPSVSRRHVALRCRGSLVVRDLGGANGTALRDHRQPSVLGETEALRRLANEEAELMVGDIVTIGIVSLVVRRVKTDAEEVEPDAEGFVLRAPAMKDLYAQALRVAATSISVLVLGETGSGKELLARYLHHHSPRAAAPFLGLNCAALPESILESELFGHEKGAFTGALQARAGLFESAHGGTVFLDEIGEMPLAIQAKLLRVIEQRSVMRLGARQERPIDLRFVAATHRDLERATSEGSFRQDLYYRLNGIALTIPPLRERVLEIEPLARSFLRAACRAFDRQRSLDFAPETVERLRAHPWPGNVRELRNVVERAVVLAPADVIYPEQLPAPRPSSVLPPTTAAPAPAGDSLHATSEALRASLLELKRERVVEALARCAGNQTQAAKLLGISRRTLVTLLGELDLPRPRRPSE
jgi:two-component system, NtrC family, response regulator AtoC